MAGSEAFSLFFKEVVPAVFAPVSTSPPLDRHPKLSGMKEYT